MNMSSDAALLSAILLQTAFNPYLFNNALAQSFI